MKNQHIAIILATAVYLAATFPSPGQITISGGDADVANTPPIESWSAGVSPGGQEKFGSTAGVFSASGPDNTSATASLALGNGTSAPFVQASAGAASAPPGIAASAGASVEYFFQINGPAGSAAIDISGVASASGTGPDSYGTATGYWGESTQMERSSTKTRLRLFLPPQACRILPRMLLMFRIRLTWAHLTRYT